MRKRSASERRSAANKEAADAKDRKRRERALERAQAAFEKVEPELEARTTTLEDERAGR